jgi:hypothetical protein
MVRTYTRIALGHGSKLLILRSVRVLARDNRWKTCCCVPPDTGAIPEPSMGLSRATDYLSTRACTPVNDPHHQSGIIVYGKKWRYGVLAASETFARAGAVS